ncbi:MAG: hypothetical protein KDB14_26310 [Planctomycetales bacterium]|nr:hypothetical protein [Planctomycetales bacterium]
MDELIQIECEAHWDRFRFSIAYNVLEARPDVGLRALEFLREDVAKRDDAYQNQLLKMHELAAAGKLPSADQRFLSGQG